MKLHGMADGFRAQLETVDASQLSFEVLFTLLAERYERGSVFISSNLPFSKWEGIFKDPMTTAAAIDRLVHHCVILELNSPSYRVEQAKKAKEESNGKILDFNQACRDGFTILHKRAAELLFRDLAVAHVDGSFGRQLTKLPRIDILVLDDFAVAPLKDGERRDFLELCDDRYQRRSMILTSQCRSPTGTNRSAIHARRQHPRPLGP